MLKHLRNFCHTFIFSTLIINFSEVWPRQILYLGKQFNLMIHFDNVLKRSLEDILKMSWRQIWKTSWRRLDKRPWRCLEDIFKRRLEVVFRTSGRSLENVLKTFLQDVLKASWKRLEGVLKTYGQDECIDLDQNVFKMSSSRRMFAGTTLLILRHIV